MYIFEVTTDTGVCIIRHSGEDWSTFASATLEGGQMAVATCARLLDLACGRFGHCLRLKSCTPDDLLVALTGIAKLRPREGFVGFTMVQVEPAASGSPVAPEDS